MRLPQVLLRRRPVDPAKAVLPRRGIQAGLAIEGFLARPGFPVDGPRVVGHLIDPRPVDVDRMLEGLADRTAVAGARKRDAPEVRLRRFPWPPPPAAARDRRSPAGIAGRVFESPRSMTRASDTHHFVAIIPPTENPVTAIFRPHCMCEPGSWFRGRPKGLTAAPGPIEREQSTTRVWRRHFWTAGTTSTGTVVEHNTRYAIDPGRGAKRP